MNELLTWRDDWLLHIDLLDADHREMLRLINGIATAEGTGLLEAMDELLAHIRSHYDREAWFLRSIDYPDFDEHQREHQLQYAELLELSRELESDSTQRLDYNNLEALKGWFLSHVVAVDRKFSNYYHRYWYGKRRVAA